MDPAIKGGFAIGFAALAIAVGLFGWNKGWIAPRADRPAETSRPAGPAAPGGQQPAPDTADKATPGAETPPAGGETAGRAPSPEAPAGETPPATPAPSANAPGAPPSSTPGEAAALTPPNAAPKPSDAAPVEKGVFDVVRVEPNGDLVAAGRCTGGCTVELTANGKTIETAKADAGGSFVLTPPALPAGDHQLGLKVTGPNGQQATSEQTVTVSVPAPPSRDVVVVLNAPDAPSKILQQPGQAPSAAKPAAGVTAERAPGAETPIQAAASLSLGAVDAENGRFFVQGTAPAGTKLRVYLNNALVAEPVAGADGRWSLKVEQGLSPGKYVARVDQIGADGKVANRAEQSFAYEAEVAAAGRGARPSGEAPSGAAAGSQSADSSAEANAAQKESATVAPSGQSAASGGVAAAPPAPGSATPSGPQRTTGGSQDGQAASGSSASNDGGAPAAQASGSSTSLAAPAQDNAAQDKSAGAAGSASGQTAAAPESASGDAANPVVKSIDTAQVKRGDSLWRISRATYGRGQRYTIIFTANDGQIRNPDLIYPGQVLVLPSQTGAAAEARPAR